MATTAKVQLQAAEHGGGTGQLNGKLATATGLLTNDPDEVGAALSALDAVVGEVRTFVTENRESLGTAADRLASVSEVLTASLDDIKQTLHISQLLSRDDWIVRQ